MDNINSAVIILLCMIVCALGCLFFAPEHEVGAVALGAMVGFVVGLVLCVIINKRLERAEKKKRG